MSTTKVVTGKVRFSYAHVHEMHAMEGGTPKYSVSIIIPKDDVKTLNKVKAAIKSAYDSAVASKFGGKAPKKGQWKNPLRDGDEDREQEEYNNAFFINASTTRKPTIVDANRDEILSNSEFYSGCYGRASLNFYGFSVNGNKGVAAGLNHLQKLSEGTALGAAISTAESDFGDDFEDAAEDDILF
tara:strand:+ start:32667 stop:33221 length:555 start_codon:yes stop_codon:yes gene_type:complete